jgi:hypothetical protein
MARFISLFFVASHVRVGLTGHCLGNLWLLFWGDVLGRICGKERSGGFLEYISIKVSKKDY